MQYAQKACAGVRLIMNLANRQFIEDAVILIEENLKNKLSLDEISESLCISKFHLHRIFRAITGMPLISYVRGRKLSSSLTELFDYKLKIIDIAYEYNFEYEQSYERAFKQLFKISPSFFRQQRCELSVVQRIDTGLINDTSHGFLIAPRYCVKHKFYLAGMEAIIDQTENYKNNTTNTNALDFYYKSRLELANCVNEQIYYGFVTYSNSSNIDFYMPSVEVSEPFSSNPPFTCRTIEACNYAVFRYVGLHPPEDLNILLLKELYDLIYMKWKPMTQFKQAGRYHFERIDLKICSSNYCEADIYMPVNV